MMVTNEQSLFERCISLGIYERTGGPSRFAASTCDITDPALKRFAGVPMGSFKFRINQTCSAMGRVQLKHYPARIAEIQAALNRFWDQLEGTPGIRAHRPLRNSGSTMGGWYAAPGLYRASELGGLPVEKFCAAVTAEEIGRAHV